MVFVYGNVFDGLEVSVLDGCLFDYKSKLLIRLDINQFIGFICKTIYHAEVVVNTHKFGGIGVINHYKEWT